MTFATGRITGSSTAALDFRTEVAAMLAAHPAWSLEKEGAIASGRSDQVWKCSGTHNSWGADFWVILYVSDGQPNQLYMSTTEAFDSATNATRFPWAGNSVYTPSSVDAGWTGSTGFTNPKWWDTVVSAVDFTWHAWVTNNGLLLASSASTYSHYAGLFEPLFPDHPSEFPLILWQFGQASADSGAVFARAPGREGVATTDAFGGKGSGDPYTMIGGTVPTSPVGAYMNKALGSRQMLRSTSSATNLLRGLAHDVLYFTTDGSVSTGDTITVGADEYAHIQSGLWIRTGAV